MLISALLDDGGNDGADSGMEQLPMHSLQGGSSLSSLQVGGKKTSFLLESCGCRQAHVFSKGVGVVGVTPSLGEAVHWQGGASRPFLCFLQSVASLCFLTPPSPLSSTVIN